MVTNINKLMQHLDILQMEWMDEYLTIQIVVWLLVLTFVAH